MMRAMLRNIFAVIAGVVVGGLVNGALIALSSSVIPPPAGADLTTPEGLRTALPLLEPRHFVMPFLAHAVGTLAGALVAFLTALSRRQQIAYGIGVLFLFGGIGAAFMIPAPAWFIAVDLIGAYLPMAWLATKVGAAMKASPLGRG